MKTCVSAFALFLSLLTMVNYSHAGEFQTQVTYEMGINPISVAVGDFNNDGKADIVVANGGSLPFRPQGSVSIRLGNGDGTFQARVRYVVAPETFAVAVADLNGDGNLDIITTSWLNTLQPYAGKVCILLGNGDGTFGNSVGYRVGRGPSSVRVADFNRDGIPDLLVVNTYSHTVSILLGSGDGTFLRHQDFHVGVDPAYAAVADFNGDGKPDVAAANYYDSTISVLLGKGDGTLHRQVVYTAGVGLLGIVAGDFNGDGIVDLALTNSTECSFSGNVSILLGNGDGTFPTSRKTYKVDSEPTDLAIGDFNNDGNLDLVTISLCSDSISVLLGKGDGSFLPSDSYNSGDRLTTVAVGDLNGDGLPDIAVSNVTDWGTGHVGLFLNTGQ